MRGPQHRQAKSISKTQLEHHITKENSNELDWVPTRLGQRVGKSNYTLQENCPPISFLTHSGLVAYARPDEVFHDFSLEADDSTAYIVPS